jgi:hypothetical protein
MLQLQAAGSGDRHGYLILQVVLMRWSVIRAGLPVKLDHEPAYCSSGSLTLPNKPSKSFGLASL